MDTSVSAKPKLIPEKYESCLIYISQADINIKDDY
jgi:hypothetical protein